MFAVHVKYQGTGPMDKIQESFIKCDSEEAAEGIAKNKLFELNYYGIPGTADIYELNLKQNLLNDAKRAQLLTMRDPAADGRMAARESGE